MAEPHFADDEQFEKLKAWWKKNGTSIVGGVGLGIAIVAGYNGWQAWTTNKAEQASAKYGEVLAAVRDEDSARATTLGNELIADHGSSAYAASTALVLARIAVGENDFETAREQLQWVANNSGDAGTVHTARLRLAYIELSEGRADAAKNWLSVDNPGAFETHYQELTGDALMLEGDVGGAVEAWKKSLAVLPPTSGYASILRDKIARAGGDEQ